MDNTIFLILLLTFTRNTYYFLPDIPRYADL